MKRFIKVVAIVIGVIVALIIAAAVLVPLFVDANQYRDEIEAWVQNKTGREFNIEGDIEVSVFPWLGVEIGHSWLANEKGFKDKPFVEFQNAQVSVRLLPLLSGQIKVGGISLDGLRLRLAVNESGDSNWDSLVKAFTGGSGKTPKEKRKQPSKQGQGGSGLPEFEIGSIAITDAAVTYRNAATNQVYKLRDFHLSTGHLVLGKPFPVDVGFTVESKQPQLTAKVDFAATVDADVEKQSYRFADVWLNVNASGPAVPGGEQQLTLTGKGSLNLASGRLEISNLKLQAAGLVATAEVTGTDVLSQAQFTGRLALEQFNPRRVMQNLGIEMPKSSDPEVLNSASLSTQFQASLNSVQLKQFVLHLDKSTIEGKASVKDFASPAITFHMSLDHMNVDRYLPAKSKDTGGGEPDKIAKPSPAGGAEISLDPLKAMDLDGRLTVGKLTVAGMTFHDAVLAVSSHDGVLRIKPLGAELYQGKLRLRTRVSAAGGKPSYSIHGDLSSLKLAPLLADLIGQQKLSALASLSIDLTATGATVKQIKRSLDGTVSFRLKDGVFHGFDLSNVLQIVRQKLFGASAQSGPVGKTTFSEFTASFSVHNGLFKGSNLSLNTPYGELTGSGSFDLVTNQLDYTLVLHVPENAQGELLSELAGYNIPIQVSGNLFSPSYSIDLQSMLMNVGRQKLQEEKAELRKEVTQEVQEARSELKQEVTQELQDALGGFFGGGDGSGDQKNGDQQAGGQQSGGQPTDKQEAGGSKTKDKAAP